MKPPSLTMGIEEEYQIIDPQTRELKSYITQMLEESKLLLREQVKAELHQSMVEVGTEVCRTPAEARVELVRLRREIMRMAARSGLKIAAAGTHPFSSWVDQEITPFERYLGVKHDMQDLAQQLLIFGTHVHIGIEDKDFIIDAMKRGALLRAPCPVPVGVVALLAGPQTPACRATAASSSAISLAPASRRFFGSWAELDHLVDTLVKTNCIPDGTKLWWDVRPSWKFPTLEFRVCDVCTRVDEAVCIAAIFQALIAKLWKLRRDNLTFRLYPLSLVEENKWRAVRYGLDGKLLDLGKQQEAPTRELITELIQWFLDDVLDELGTRKQVEYAFEILRNGNSASRQVATFQQTGDLKAVVDQLIRETEEGVNRRALSWFPRIPIQRLTFLPIPVIFKQFDNRTMRRGEAMAPLDRRAADMRDLVQDILKQFQSVNAAAANGPHADLNMQEMRVVEFLGESGPRMMRELSEHLSVAVNSVTSIVDGMERKSLVRRQRSETDRRVIRVELAEQGAVVFQAITAMNMGLFRSMLGALTEDEQEIFMVLFRKIARAGRSQALALAGSA